MHFPVFPLISGSFCGHSADHRVAMHADQRIMMKFQAELLWIPVQKFFHKGMPGPANGTFIVTKLDQGQLRVLRAPDMSAALNLHMLRCIRVIDSLIRAAAQEYGERFRSPARHTA